MPYAAKRPCAAPGCTALVDSTRYCAEHARPQNGAWDHGGKNARQRGYTWAWQRQRRWLLSHEPLCRICAKNGAVRLAVEVDHIQPKAQGGTDDLANLQPLCRSCHDAKTKREHGMGRSQGVGGAKSGAR